MIQPDPRPQTLPCGASVPSVNFIEAKSDGANRSTAAWSPRRSTRGAGFSGVMTMFTKFAASRLPSESSRISASAPTNALGIVNSRGFCSVTPNGVHSTVTHLFVLFPVGLAVAVDAA